MASAFTTGAAKVGAAKHGEGLEFHGRLDCPDHPP